MNKEQQRRTIAEACGWTKCEHVASINLTKGIPPANNPPKYGTYENGMAQLPDYPNDLNAMREAEKVLTAEQQKFYASILGGLTYNDNGRGWQPLANDDCFPILHATAEQRSEAFLRTIDKWTTNQLIEP